MEFLESIYPLTIVKRRFGGCAIINVDTDCEAASALQGYEEYYYNPHLLMKEEWEGIEYGIGNTLDEAIENYKQNK